MAHATRLRPTTGTEANRPAGRHHYAEVALVALFIAVLVAVSSTLKDPQHFPIREVRIEGDLVHLVEADFRARLAGVTEQGLFSVDVHALRAHLLEEPWVREVSIRRVWPHTLMIRVTEQVAVARWNQGQGVNVQGQTFDPPDADLAADLPQLSGPPGSIDTVLATVQVVDVWFERMGLAQTSVRLTDHGDWWIGIAGGQTLVLGHDDLTPRLHLFSLAFKNYLRAQWDQVARIDMRYPNGMAVQWKKDEEN